MLFFTICYHSNSILFQTFPNVLEHIWIINDTRGRTCTNQQPSIRYDPIIMLCQSNTNMTHYCTSSSSRSSATCSTVATSLNWYFGAFFIQMTRHMTIISLCINSSSVSNRKRSSHITLSVLQEDHSIITVVVTTISISTSTVMAVTTISLSLSLY